MMRRFLAGTLFILTVVTGLNGCAMARQVMMEEGGGVVAIPDNIDIHRERAEALMFEHCPNGFTIVREEEVVVGSRTTHRHKTEDTETGEEGVAVSETRDETEWQITYKCN